MTANSDRSKQNNKAAHRVLAGVLCGASVLSLVLSLVMPPISQAIANDAQTVSTEETVMGGGSSSESTDVDNSTNGDAGTDAENQNSDDAASDDDARPEEQSKDESQAEDNDAMDVNAVASAEEAAESEETTTAITNIANADDLSAKLQGVGENQTACFELTADIDYAGEIKLEKSGSNITLNLNGHKIKCLNTDKPLFDVANGATLTIKDEIKDSAPVTETVNDVQQLTDQGQKLHPDNYGKKAVLNYVDGIPSNLTYYVTKSTPSGTGTIETLVSHSVDIKGAIVACGGNTNLKLINLYNNNGKGGTFNLVSGVITQKQGGSVSSLVYAENGSTVNMSGGYVCGASGSPAGAGIMVSNEKGSASTLNLTGGVIAGNSAYSGGGVYALYSEVTITNGIISGNSTLNEGLGGGIMAEGGIVNVSGGYITNNRMAKFCCKDGDGCHGGAGLAANSGVHVTISGGQITGNYSEEAGGGVYVTNLKQGGMAWLDIKGGYIASNVSYRSEGAGIRVGQRVDAMINGPKDSNGTKKSTVYITNNRCMSRYDWGGGGIFVQGDSINADNAGRLFVYNSYISSNTAGGYGGGVAVCPSGKTLVTNTEGTAIFGNKSADNEFPGEDHPNPAYKQEGNSGNDKAPHLSKGGDGKNQDYTAYLKPVFRDNGHADFFLAAHDHNTPIAVVTGEMLGGGDARYSGSIELEKAINIPANGAVGVKNSIGLTSGVMSGVMAKDEAAINARNQAQNEATTFITGNYSWDHGGGIMSNGDLYLGVPADTYVYPSLKLKATKALKMKNKQSEESMALAKDQFSFSVYRKDSDDATEPFWNDKTFNRGGCTLVGTARNDADGNITFDLGEQFIGKTVEANKITYYLVEDAGDDSDITYDPAVYEIVVSVKDNPTELMTVPEKNNPNGMKKLLIHNYTITSVTAKKGDSTVPLAADADGVYALGSASGSGATFTNRYTPYSSKGTWTPMATKVVKGGEMKEFTLEFADNLDFNEAKTVVTNPMGEIITTADGGKSQTLSFDKIAYKLDQLNKLPADSTGRGASKTFTYYVREQQPNTPFAHYKYDESVYQITVNAVDDSQGKINVNATYKQIQDRDGKPVTTDTPHDLTESTPTFTNTYSTSLPLSGMSGVTLTYLAGAAVLCAAAAWMHIRRKANAKGGERRE